MEAPVTFAVKPIPKTGPSLRATSLTLDALKYCGFDVLALANNHIMDFGAVGLRDTIEACERSGISLVGAGLDYESVRKPLMVIASGLKIAFINVAENEFSTIVDEGASANPLDPVANFYSIREARHQADLVFVVVHGGHESFRFPSPRMQQTFRFFVDAGASAVVCHHSHCFSGYEIYNGAPIFYGLGNFVFDDPGNRSREWCEGYAVKFLFRNGKLEFHLIPFVQNAARVGTHLLAGAEIEAFFRAIEDLNQTIARPERLAVEFEKLCDARRYAYEACLEPYSNSTLHAVRRKGYLPAWFGKKKRLRLLNIVRCESHRDVLLGVLKRSMI